MAAGCCAYVAVGSNVQPEANLPRALGELLARASVTACSTFYRTEPLGPPGQPAFVNGMWEVLADRDPRALRDEVLRDVERACGRVRGENRYAPRSIDLDLVWQDGAAPQTGGPVLHSPDLARPFVLLPLLEIRPDLAGRPALARAVGSPQAVRDIQAGPPPGEPLTDLTRQLKEMLNR